MSEVAWKDEVSVPGIEVDACPHCGSDYGWYYIVIERWQQDYTWDGVAIAASDGEPYGNAGKRAYCIECKKTVTKFIPSFLDNNPGGL